MTPNGASQLTLTVLGCGTMGVAILSGILASPTLASLLNPSSSPHQLSPSGTSTPLFPPASSEEPLPPPNLPTRFLACVKRPQTATRLRVSLPHPAVEIFVNENVKAVKEAHVVLLGCKPQVCEEILTQEGMQEALEGKLLVSILAGVKSERLAELCPPSTRVVRAMPNTASKVNFNSLSQWHTRIPDG